MLAIFSVAFPVLVRTTVFPVLVPPMTTLPNTNDVGERETTGPPPAVIVSWIVVWCVSAPDTPVIVTVEVPSTAEGLTLSVRVLLVGAGFGENPAVTPLGRLEALKVTLPLKPFTGLIVIVL